VEAAAGASRLELSGQMSISSRFVVLGEGWACVRSPGSEFVRIREGVTLDGYEGLGDGGKSYRRSVFTV
jgi:hypothetical protein